ncbi:MAG: MarR family transcriptional regulator [Clostridia bacterium]|nr:MarR family transcriptional regulator [Clostridia bacterium]MBQ4575382.1 MarR family transcriptional regulator [Clostridia bacterium]
MDNNEINRNITSAEESLDLSLMRMMRRCGHMLYHRNSPNYSQNKILLLLKRKGSMSQRALCDELRIQAGSLSEILCKVESAGYIEKCRCDDDKRNIFIHITEAGLEQAERFEREREEIAHKLFANLDISEKEALLATLTKLLSEWESMCCCCCDKKNEKENLPC